MSADALSDKKHQRIIFFYFRIAGPYVPIKATGMRSGGRKVSLHDDWQIWYIYITQRTNVLFMGDVLGAHKKGNLKSPLQ